MRMKKKITVLFFFAVTFKKQSKHHLIITTKNNVPEENLEFVTLYENRGDWQQNHECRSMFQAFQSQHWIWVSEITNPCVCVYVRERSWQRKKGKGETQKDGVNKAADHIWKASGWRQMDYTHAYSMQVSHNTYMSGHMYLAWLAIPRRCMHTSSEATHPQKEVWLEMSRGLLKPLRWRRRL